MKILCILLAAGVVVGCARPVHGELANGIIAIVHDAVITRDDVELLTSQTAEVLRRQYRNQPEVFEKKMVTIRVENLDKLMAQQLILHEFKTAGYNLPESIIDDEVQNRIQQRFMGDRVALTKTLEAEGMTNEKFRERVRDQFIIEVMRQKNISSSIIISPHKVETYYLAHKEDFKIEDEVKLRMIVLTNGPQAAELGQEILSKLKEGVPFDEMARMYSQGSQRNQGGDWGWVERSVLRKELADAAFSLKAGERSGVIAAPEACYLMLVEDKHPAHLKSLGEVRDQIERDLLLQERSRLEKQWIERLKKKTFVRLFS